MSSPNKSFIHVWHKYQNITKPFFFSGRTYNFQKTTEKSTKASNGSYASFYRYLCRSRFRFIILKEKLRCKSQGMNFEKELFRTQPGIWMKYRGCKTLYRNVWNIKDCWKQKKTKEDNITDNIKKDELITVHKNQTIKDWFRQTNLSVIHVWHIYKNFTKSFFFGGTGYMIIKNNSKIEQRF